MLARAVHVLRPVNVQIQGVHGLRLYDPGDLEASLSQAAINFIQELVHL